MLCASLQDFLQGAKKTGVRRFTDGAPDGFFRKPAVLPAIRARQHSPIRGFVPQNRKTREEFCAILDLRAEEPRATAIPDSLCGEQERCRGMRPLPAHRKECPGDPPRPAGYHTGSPCRPPPLPGGCRKGVPARRSSPSVLRGGIPRHLPQQGNCLLSITQEGRRVTGVLPLYGRNPM